MPVRFKGLSEYDRNFNWKGPDGQEDPVHASRWAGLRSDELGITKEPGFTSKRRVPYYNTQISKSFQWEEDVDMPKHEKVKAVEPVKIQPVVEKDRQVEEEIRTPDAPRIQKAPTSLSAPLRQESTHTLSQVKKVPVNKQEHKKEVLTVATRKPPQEHHGFHRVLAKKAGMDLTPSQHPLKVSEYRRQFERKSPVESAPLIAAEQVVYNKNQAVPPFKVPPVNTQTEYNSQFKGSPPAKGPKLRKTWEEKYIREYEPENHIRRRKDKKKRTNIVRTPNKAGQTTIEQNETGERKILRERLVQQLSIPSKGYRKVKTEYSANFLSPSEYKYKDGAWVRTKKEMPEQDSQLSVHSMWVAEVKELRERAAFYKHRTEGTHFSRDHLNQILSANNRMWDVSSNSSSEEQLSNNIKALDLAGLDTTNKNEKQHELQVKLKPTTNTGNLGISENPTMPVRRRLVWDEEGAEPVQDEGTLEVNGAPTGSPPCPPLEGMEGVEENGEKITKRLDSTKINKPDDRSESTSVSSDVTGRLPTPKLKLSGKVQRTHHDLTTPASGGALLVSPAKPHCHTPELTKKKGACEGHHAVTKPVSKEYHKTSKDMSSLSPPTAGIRTVDPVPLRHEDWPSNRVFDRPSTPEFSYPINQSHAQKKIHSLPQWSPSCRIHGALRDPEFQHNGDFGIPALYKSSLSGDQSIDDDRLSQISARSAASSSFASEILERAQKRKEHFWGKK
ncbi:nuclear protein MDM1 isoform X1 [Pelobates fuscus]|uniref:nuclear protein MDM1 isoform X1 n=1 Tax=Pelobates fuscus TaxID=191477 RepID=UPI002FE48188